VAVVGGRTWEVEPGEPLACESGFVVAMSPVRPGTRSIRRSGYQEHTLVFIDTAGLRKRTKVADDIEF